jgi:hypothetical protein
MPRDVRAHQGPDCPQHALARTEQSGAIREGQALLQGDRRLRPLRAQAEGSLPVPTQPPQPRLPLHSLAAGRRVRQVVPQESAPPNRRGDRGRAARQAHARRGRPPRCAPPRRSRPATTARSTVAPPDRARPLRGRAKEGHYRQVEPEHRLVARRFERQWKQNLSPLAAAEAELELRQRQRPRILTPAERERLLGSVVVALDLVRPCEMAQPLARSTGASRRVAGSGPALCRLPITGRGGRKQSPSAPRSLKGTLGR